MSTANKRLHQLLLGPDKCRECGSMSLTWDTHSKTDSGVQEGRLRSHEVKCLFVLGCDECSETLGVVNADKLAALLNATASIFEPVNPPAPSHADGQLNIKAPLFMEIRASLPVNEDGEPAQYLINEAQLQRVLALECREIATEGVQASDIPRTLLDTIANGYAQEQGHAINELRALLANRQDASKP